ncbi:MAG: S-layer homology domain-containing protein [Oscillibacter sp.]|nr:S-layer homology domain-containing protein [Oscillibacter sp.]
MDKRMRSWVLAGCLTLSVAASAAETESPKTAPPAPPAEITVAGPSAAEPSDASANPFEDVKADSPFLPGILYAVDKGITKGTTPKTFSPYMLCTRGQILTFLWRAWGSPEPADDNPFPDLEPEAYYYKAALWSYQMGLLDGTSFDPYGYCTRLDAVVYLWKLAGAPASYDSRKGEFPFTDVSDNPDAQNAVAWAALESFVTNGTTATTFSPDKRCTRSQIVTFIYRALGGNP